VILYLIIGLVFIIRVFLLPFIVLVTVFELRFELFGQLQVILLNDIHFHQNIVIFDTNGCTAFDINNTMNGKYFPIDIYNVTKDLYNK